MSNINKELLKQMINASSTSGYEEPVQRIWRDYVKNFADRIDIDVHGNSIGVINPDAELRVMLSGHSDEIGYIVTYIDDNGFVYLNGVGGVDPNLLPGSRLFIYTKNGKILGVVGKKPWHLIKNKDSVKLEMSDIWVDIGAASKEDAEKRVSIGDTAGYTYGFDKLTDDLIVGRGIDNRIGSFITAEVIKRVKEKGTKIGFFGVSSVQEEIGCKGAEVAAYSIKPHVGLAVDVTFSTDFPGLSSEKNRLGDIKLGKGPVIALGPTNNKILSSMLRKTAEENKIDYQIETTSRRTGTDADSIHTSRSGVAAGVISIPNRYMHTPVEVVSLHDVEKSIELISEFIINLDPKTSFIPQ